MKTDKVDMVDNLDLLDLKLPVLLINNSNLLPSPTPVLQDLPSRTIMDSNHNNNPKEIMEIDFSSSSNPLTTAVIRCNLKVRELLNPPKDVSLIARRRNSLSWERVMVLIE